MTARPSKEAYEAKGIHLWQIPPRSPDLNPIEKFWGWLQKDLPPSSLHLNIWEIL